MAETDRSLLPWHHWLAGVLIGLAITVLVIGLDTGWTFTI